MFYYSLAGMAIAIGINRMAHLSIGSSIIEQLRHAVDNPAKVGTHKFHCAGSHSLGALGSVTHHKHWLAKPGSLFLDSTAIGEHKIGLAHEINKAQVLKWFYQKKISCSGSVDTKCFV